MSWKVCISFLGCIVHGTIIGHNNWVCSLDVSQMVYNFCWRANIMQRWNDEIVNRRNLRKLFKQDKICEIALKKKLLFSPLTYLITNSLTRSYLTRPDGCIVKVLLKYLLDWLIYTSAKKATSSLTHWTLVSLKGTRRESRNEDKNPQGF